jgi:hypothetical protein
MKNALELKLADDIYTVERAITVSVMLFCQYCMFSLARALSCEVILLSCVVLAV